MLTCQSHLCLEDSPSAVEVAAPLPVCFSVVTKTLYSVFWPNSGNLNKLCMACRLHQHELTFSVTGDYVRAHVTQHSIETCVSY